MRSAKLEDVQLPYLETFSKAAEWGGFTAAAKVLRISQAAVSQRIHALERTLRVSLFQRLGGHVLLTEAGQRLYRHAQRILDLHLEAREELTGQKAPVAGNLLLAASSIPGEHLLPELLSVFRRRFPGIQVRVTVSDSMAVMDQIEHGHVNLGLVGRKSDNPHLEFQSFAKDKMVLVVSPKHAWRKRTRASITQLCGQPLILREAGSGLRHCFEKSLASVGRSLGDLRIALELGSNESIKEAVLRNMGVAILSTYAVHKELRRGQLHKLEVTDLDCDREMFVVWDRRRVLPPPARIFRFFLESNPLPVLHKPSL
jgi:LysR family transcriptional regulator, low CO2-responsive transcriptional regulator